MNNAALPYDYYPNDTQGRPLFNAYIYMGVPNLDPETPANQIDVYGQQEDGSNVLLAQPIRTGAGGVPMYNGSPVVLKTDESFYSIKILDRDLQQIYYNENVAAVITASSGSIVNKVNTVADLAATQVIAGAVYYLKEYNAGTGVGGGELLGVAGSATYNNVLTFEGIGGYFKRINYSNLNAAMSGVYGSGTETAKFQAIYDVASVGDEITISPGVYTCGSLTGTKTVYWRAYGALDGGGNPLNLPGIVDTSYARKRQVWQHASQPNDETVYQFIREANHTGGTGGVTSACVAVKTIASAGATNYEWPLKVELENYTTGSDAAENSATFFSALKFGTCPTWAITTQVIDYQSPASGAAISLELGLAGNGTDAAMQRNLIQLAPNVRIPLASGGSFYEVGRGVWAAGLFGSLAYIRSFASEGAFKEAAFFNNANSSAYSGSTTFKDSGFSDYGIDLSNATYGTAALRFSANQVIYFENTNQAGMRFNSSNGRLEFIYAGIVRGHVDFSLADHAF